MKSAKGAAAVPHSPRRGMGARPRTELAPVAETYTSLA